jgi:hypothetical protein
MAREQISLMTPTNELLRIMGEGNIGSMNIIMNILTCGDVMKVKAVLDLDDMNIRGPAIWYAFRDWAGQDWDKFFKALDDRDEKLVEFLNNCNDVNDRKYVTGGASYER